MNKKKIVLEDVCPLMHIRAYKERASGCQLAAQG
jgi:hypothetical protein